jgi:hypothetical protein
VMGNIFELNIDGFFIKEIISSGYQDLVFVVMHKTGRRINVAIKESSVKNLSNAEIATLILNEAISSPFPNKVIISEHDHGKFLNVPIVKDLEYVTKELDASAPVELFAEYRLAQYLPEYSYWIDAKTKRIGEAWIYELIP